MSADANRGYWITGPDGRDQWLDEIEPDPTDDADETYSCSDPECGGGGGCWECRQAAKQQAREDRAIRDEMRYDADRDDGAWFV